jgi:hypothetical protein
MTTGPGNGQTGAGTPRSAPLALADDRDDPEAIQGVEASTRDPVRSPKNPQNEAEGGPDPETRALEAARAEALLHRDGPNGRRRIGRRGLQAIEKLATNGHADVTIAKALRMDRETFRHLRRRDPRVEEALVRGRSQLEDALVHTLLRRAMNPKDPAGAASAMFLLKSRCGYREGHVAPTAGLAVAAENVQIVMPPSLSAEQFGELLARTTGRRELGDGGGRER